MRSMSPPQAPADTRRVRVLRNLLLESGYSIAGANQSVLGDLFLRGVPMNRRFVADAVAPLSPADLPEMGLCVIRGDSVHPRVSLEPHDGLIFAGDLPRGRRDQVGGVSRAGITLSHLTVRNGAVSTLDLGTGCGLQALLSAGHSSQVTATDVNRRALRFAAFNAALNGIANVEFRQGTWCEPVRGRKFDLIVANPPMSFRLTQRSCIATAGCQGTRSAAGSSARHRPT